MNYPLLINVIQVVVSLLLIGVILLQQRGSGLSATFGGDANVYHTRRGIEKMLFWSTVLLASAFILLGFFNLILPKIT